MREYITVEGVTQRVIWRLLTGSSYVEIAPDADRIIRSRVFPGLWLDPAALWANNRPRMHLVAAQGLASPEHRAFAAELRSRYK